MFNFIMAVSRRSSAVAVTHRVQLIDKNNILKEIERMRSIDKHYNRINSIIHADPKERSGSLGSFTKTPR